jgi:lysophospholipase L1-like esterase
MLGDSITQGVEWNELLGRTDISNRGIGGDTTAGFLKRLPNIYTLKPELCFIMGGINDIGIGISVETIQDNMGKIITALLEHEIQPIMQSTLYVSNKTQNWKKTNNKVDAVNNWLKEICREQGLIFVDINNILSENGTLKNEYTYDGVHLNGLGYKEWGKIIKPMIIEEK